MEVKILDNRDESGLNLLNSAACMTLLLEMSPKLLLATGSRITGRGSCSGDESAAHADGIDLGHVHEATSRVSRRSH